MYVVLTYNITSIYLNILLITNYFLAYIVKNTYTYIDFIANR